MKFWKIYTILMWKSLWFLLLIKSKVLLIPLWFIVYIQYWKKCSISAGSSLKSNSSSCLPETIFSSPPPQPVYGKVTWGSVDLRLRASYLVQHDYLDVGTEAQGAGACPSSHIVIFRQSWIHKEKSLMANPLFIIPCCSVCCEAISNEDEEKFLFIIF